MNHSGHSHTKVAGCSCRVCLIAGMNANAKGVVDEAHMRQLERFHAYIHKVQAKKHAADAKRSALADGRIEADGVLVRTPRLEREKYERDLAKWKAANARVPRAKRLQLWIDTNRPSLRSGDTQHSVTYRGKYEIHYLQQQIASDGSRYWYNGDPDREPKRCADCRRTMRILERFQAQAEKRAAAIGIELGRNGEVQWRDMQTPMKPSEPPKWSPPYAGHVSKFVGKSRKKIPAGYRPRRKKAVEVPMQAA